MLDFELESDCVLVDRFKIINLIGKGTFGKVYSAKDLLEKHDVAVKVEVKKGNRSQLVNESKILQELQGLTGFPKIIFSGKHDDLNILVMELLGNSIRSKFIEMNKSFSLQTIVLLTEQMLERIKSLHDKNYFHRDIKPQQFVLPLKQNDKKIFMIDFGLSKKFKNKLGMHLQYSENNSFAGTYHYASINAQNGIQQGRRDDLESMMYSIAYLFRGDLP